MAKATIVGSSSRSAEPSRRGCWRMPRCRKPSMQMPVCHRTRPLRRPCLPETSGGRAGEWRSSAWEARRRWRSRTMMRWRCRSSHGRWTERYIGQVMKKRRAEAFLASKTKERTRDGSLRMIEESLKLLQTDHLDLWQLHDVGTMGEVNQIFDKGGALEALTEAREQKMVRFLGLTGHFRP